MNFKQLVILSFFFISKTAITQGLLVDKEAEKNYNNVLKKHSALVNNPEGLPASYDLSKYAPSVMQQGNYGTCVGVSVAYYMRTILEAKRLNLTDKSKIDALRFSPTFVYNSVKKASDADCEAGIDITTSMEFIKNTGIANLKQVPYHNCDAKVAGLKVNPESKILDYIRIFDLLDRVDDVTLLTKKALAEGTPVVAGITITESLNNMDFLVTIWQRIKLLFGYELSESEDFRLWLPKKSKKTTQRHAICIVGYDNNKYGGAFRAVNSWGTWWGDKGYFWIKYSDFPNITRFCYQAYLSEKIEPEKIELAAKVKLLFDTDNSGERVPFFKNNTKNYGDSSSKLVSYNLVNPQETGTKYSFEANVVKQSYLYIIGKNETLKEANLLFPNLADSTSELLGANTKFLLPRQQWSEEDSSLVDKQYELYAPSGREYWLFLFSKTKLNINDYIQKINSQKGSFASAIIESFGNDLVPHDQVEYDEKAIGFTLKKNKHPGNIVAVMIRFDHVKSRRVAFARQH